MVRMVGIVVAMCLCCFILAPALHAQHGCLHGMWSKTENQTALEALTGKGVALVKVFYAWNPQDPFPIEKCKEIYNLGGCPVVNWELRDLDPAHEYNYPLDAIIDGKYDTYISESVSRIEQLKEYGRPIFLILGHEMNGNWYDWSGANNGASMDGPARFVQAIQHIVNNLNPIRSESGGLCRIIWAPNSESVPNEQWNSPERYYPGDEFVDWIGFSGYNWGNTQPWGWKGFNEIFLNIYTRFRDYGKPLMINETASVEDPAQPDRKALWIKDVLEVQLKGPFDGISAIIWLNEEKVEGSVLTNWRVDSSPQSLAAYRDAVKDPYYRPSCCLPTPTEDVSYPGGMNVQYFPQPAGSFVTLTFTSKQSGNGRIDVYDILGRWRGTVHESFFNEGPNSVVWSTSALPNGVYHCTLRSPAGIGHVMVNIVH